MLKKVCLSTIITLFSFACCFSVARAAELFVSSDGGNVPPYGSWAVAAQDIQTAVNAASEGDTIWISNGAYLLSATISLDKNLNLYGYSDEKDVIIDGQGTVHCFELSADAASSVFSNLFITGGYSSERGGGLYVRGITIKDCVFSNNVGSTGGAIASPDAPSLPLIVEDTLFTRNSASLLNGGAVFWRASDMYILGCEFIENEAGNNGGAVYSYLVSNFEIRNTKFFNNSAALNGGGAYAYDSAGIISNCVAENNSTPNSGGGIYLRNISATQGTDVYDSLFKGNQSTGEDGGLGDGGGLYVFNGKSIVHNCKFFENEALSEGGALVPRGAGVEIRNCLIAQNSAGSRGGGIRVGAGAGAQTQLFGCTIVSNVANSDAGVYAPNNYAYTSVNCIVYYNVKPSGEQTDISQVSENAEFRNNCISRVITGDRCSDNITDEPEFVSFETGDYRLSETSPCVNQGLKQAWMAEASDLDGRARLDKFSGLVDMGCYEYLPQGVMFKLR